MHKSFPFAAVVGQERVKRALLLCLVNPRIGGVLLSGEKGTAKSTIVRSAAQLGERQMVELPLNATEDMLVGSVDFETTIREGKRHFAPGILARANGGILYVDEVNLLADSLASAVVEAAASGENRAEREGISARHESKFILVGTMNPEEGGLRPQLLDKFGLYVEVEGEKNELDRVEIIRRRLAYERDSAAFAEAYLQETEKLKKTLAAAIALMPETTADDNARRIAAKLAEQAGCEGNRAELLLVETALAAAALSGRRHVSIEDLKTAAEFVLPHRRREIGEETAQPPQDSEEETDSNEQEGADNEDAPSETQETADEENREDGEGQEMDAEYAPDPPQTEDSGVAPEERVDRGEEIYEIIRLQDGVRDRLERRGTGRRRRTNSGANKGRYAGTCMTKTAAHRDLAFDATLRAAAPYQRDRDKQDCAVALRERDFRYKKRECHVGATVLFVVDASGSMGAAHRMKETKEAVLSMLMDSYQKRDKIGLIAFRQRKAEVLLDITSSVDLAEKELQALPTGGRTPLADGIYRAWQLFRGRRRKDPEMLPLLVLVTDGRANSGIWSDDPVEDALQAAGLIADEHIPAIVIDTENDFISFHLAEKVADAMGAAYFKVNELKSTQLRGIVALHQRELNG